MYTDEYGVQFSDDKKTLICQPDVLEGVYMIPEGVTTIKSQALWWTDIVAIVIPEGVTTIGQAAISYCMKLRDVVLPASLASCEQLGQGMYENHSLENVYVPIGYKDIVCKQLGFVTWDERVQELDAEQWKAKAAYIASPEYLRNLEEQERLAKEEAERELEERREAWLPEWKKSVEQMIQARANGAHTLVVDLEIFLGCSCSGGWNGAEKTVEVEVADDIADTILTMLENAEPDKEGEFYVSDQVLWAAVKNGHPELEPLHDDLAHRCHMMEVAYWCEEVYECLDESLEPYFYKDVENGLYTPETDEDYAPEDYFDNPEEEDEDTVYRSFTACRDNYLAWVRSHTDDPYFMAERLGIEPGACDSDYSFRIKEIK